MIILLPPSEGKAAAGSGPPVDLGTLSFPQLTETRERVLDALVALCSGPEPAALAALGLGPRQAADLAANRAVRSAPTLPAAELYTGVLYEALALASLDAAARRQAENRLVVCSGLWGMLRPGDRVPPYRLPIGVSLPGLGGLAGVWRPALTPVLDAYAAGTLVLDLRSSGYAAAWRPGREARVVTARVYQVRPDGSRAAVSHHNKATKGRLARSLLQTPEEPATPAELADLLTALGWKVELTPGWTLDVLVERV
ncbi:hypothetical protein C3Y87_05825 [Carbonactinospora thermoautotrophica]|uniref:YaaA family protein n=1 Tax=Carbonactinospora thermoautotrophica TaxID=1469144 RepID=UPI00226F36E6|nr:peroxide stress protein YaaA [Carbonactinospora thermoautotrophica]MCX9190937.1 hypothetical protein [Carbonactinospora thermoautotrophica]